MAPFSSYFSHNSKRPDSDANFCYRYPHPAVTADCVVFGFDGKLLKLLLIERGGEPFLGYWALPGGFMHIDETIEEAAARELREETNLEGVYLDQFKVFSNPGRDPRERVITVAFIALVKPEDYQVIAGDDAARARWFDAAALPPLAFDHRDIVAEAREHLKEVLRLRPVAFELLGKCFTISELQTLYEVVNNASYDRRNFLRTAVESKVITEVETSTPAEAEYEMPCRCECSESDMKAEDTFDSCNSCAPAPASQPPRSRRQPKLYKLNRDVESGSSVSSQKLSKKPKSPTKGLFDFLKS